MDRQAFFELIDKWMNGDASESEVQSLMNYYYSFKEAPEWDASVLGAKAQLEAEMEQQLLQRIRHTQQNAVVVPMPARHFPWRKLAAAVVIAAVLALGWLFRDTWRQPPVQQLQLVTDVSQHRQVQLPDGTQVWLSPSSTLQYPDRFAGRTREVSLKGEAFFSVAPGQDQPFIIHSGEVDTKVLGTSFNIQAYAAQPNIGVTVITGKVAVSPVDKNGAAPVAVTPNQRAVFSKQTGSLHTSTDVDAVSILLRRQGILRYRGAPLPEVTKELGYYYNVTIAIEGPTADCFYFGEFNTNSQLEKALHQLCLTLNATLVKDGNNWIIRKSRC